MSAIDTFEWFVHTFSRSLDDETSQFLARQREYLFTLRSEDERQRFVENVIRELKTMALRSNVGSER